jgi:hypothetical protein
MNLFDPKKWLIMICAISIGLALTIPVGLLFSLILPINKDSDYYCATTNLGSCFAVGLIGVATLFGVAVVIGMVIWAVKYTR